MQHSSSREIGWRTVIVDSESELSCSDGNLVVENLDKIIPLSQVRTLFVNSLKTSLTTGLINELTKRDISVIFCNERYNPSAELVSYGNHTDNAGRLMDQAQWDIENKAAVWKNIVEQKIEMQCKLLKYLKIEVPRQMYEYLDKVELNDSSNREGQAARIYFDSLFGFNFIRHADDNINAALNYGYTILLSSVNRILALHGYKTELGINHCSRQNKFNLSCDIMEPFRPFVDLIVYKNKGRELDWEYRKELISLTNMPVCCDGKIMELQNALEVYGMNILKSFEEKNLNKKEINFVE